MTLLTFLLVIIGPLEVSYLSFLIYLSSTNLVGWRYHLRTELEAPTPCLFPCGALEAFGVVTFFSGKMNLAAPKIMFLHTYLILYFELKYIKIKIKIVSIT